MSESTLHALAAGLCADRGIRVSLGETWSYHADTHTIEVPQNELAALGPLACAGVVAHEVGHAWLSRYHSFGPIGTVPEAAWIALNAFEDGRVERWMTLRYPGVARWLEAANAAAGEGPETPLLSFLMAAVREAAGLRPTWGGPLAPLVQVALQATRAARLAYVNDFLPDARLVPASDAFASWQSEVAPRDRHDTPEDLREAWVRVLAFRAVAHAEATLMPWVERLLEEERHALACALAPTSGPGGHSMPRKLRRGMVAGVLAEATLGQRCDRPEVLTRAGELLRDFYRRVCESSPVGRGVIRGAGLPQHGERHHTRYSDLLADTAAVRARLLEALRPAFPPTDRRPAGHARSYGTRVSLRHAYAAAADPRHGTRVFVHPGPPGRPRPAFTLLLDLSGSMRGPKIMSAMRGVVAVAEVLDELKIPFALDGFQDERIPVVAHGEPLTGALRMQIAELSLEVSGARPGGHNAPGHNDDGPCVLEAARRLACVPADSRWLLVMSDGRPEGRRSTEKDLRAIAEIGAMRPRVHLVGLGLGEGADHVMEFYPRNVAEIAVDALPGRLLEIVKECAAA